MKNKTKIIIGCSLLVIGIILFFQLFFYIGWTKITGWSLLIYLIGAITILVTKKYFIAIISLIGAILLLNLVLGIVNFPICSESSEIYQCDCSGLIKQEPINTPDQCVGERTACYNFINGSARSKFYTLQKELSHNSQEYEDSIDRLITEIPCP